MSATAIDGWWHGPHLDRFLADLAIHTLVRLRPGRPIVHRSGGDPLAGADIDSLDRLRIAVAVAEALFADAGAVRGMPQTTSFAQLLEWIRRALVRERWAVGFHTSGSTGAPRLVIHSRSTLAQEIEVLAGLFHGRKRIVALVPANHIYGFLFSVLLPERLGASVVDARACSPLSLAADLIPGDLVVAVPAIWQAIAEARFALPGDVVGVTSGAPCPPDVARLAAERGLERLVEIYGSTETGGIGWRDDPQRPFEVFAYWSRCGDGEIVKAVDGKATTFELPDHVAWHGDAALSPQRRRDGAVQVGGVNVHPEVVRGVLRAHPAVADALVRMMRPDEGDRLKAFVVPKEPATATLALRQELERWLADRLQPMERPRAIMFGRSLPANAMGKATDWIISD